MSTHNDRLQELFWALSDSTRRSIMDLLAQHGSLTVSQISDHFPHLVRSGISKHLMELRRLNMVYVEKRGREHYYSINPQAIKEFLYPLLHKYEKYCDDRLHKLKSVAESQMKAIKNNESREE